MTHWSEFDGPQDRANQHGQTTETHWKLEVKHGFLHARWRYCKDGGQCKACLRRWRMRGYITSANGIEVEVGHVVLYGYGHGIARCKVVDIKDRGQKPIKLETLDPHPARPRGAAMHCRDGRLLWVLR